MHTYKMKQQFSVFLSEHINGSLKSLLVFCIACFSIKAGHAQKIPTLREVQAWNLPSSKNIVTAYYSTGFERKVEDVRPLTEEMMRFYNKKLNINDSFVIVILSREQWSKYLPDFPYGLLIVWKGVAFIPATADGVLNRGTMALKDKVSTSTIKKIEKCGYTFDEAARRYTDLILLHELGHSYTKAYGINTMNNQMLTEFTASYFAHAFLKQKHEKLALLFSAMVTDIYLEAYQPKYTSLQDFERLFLNVGADNYSWYQAHFLQKGAEIYKTKKLTFLRELKQSFPIESKEKLTDDSILERLEKLSPGFINWSQNLK